MKSLRLKQISPNKTKSILFFVFSVFVGMMFFVEPALASSPGPLDTIVSRIESSLRNTPLLFSIFCYIFGLFFITTGLFKTRNHIDDPRSQPIAGALARVFGGGALMAAPTVVMAVQDLLATGGAPNSGAPADLPSGSGIGLLIDNATAALRSPEAFFALIAYLFGLALVVWAIVEFMKSAENGNQTPLRRPIMITFTASALLALPDILYSLRRVFFANPASGITGVAASTNPAGGTGLDQIFARVIRDLYSPMLDLFGHVSWIAGVALALVAIFRLMKSAQEGSKGPAGMGTISTFIAAAALTSLPAFMGVANESIFGSAAVSNFTALASSGGDPAVVGRANEAIKAVFLFVRLVGYFSFIRGIFILRSFADGNGQATMAAGFTHIIGGALAINLAGFVKAVQDTLGLTAVSVGA